MKKIATVISAGCPRTRIRYGIRIELRNSVWHKTWGFIIPKKSNENFSAEVDISSGLPNDSKYNGCPSCGAVELVQCGGCNTMMCFKGEEFISCPGCGKNLRIQEGGWDAVSGGGY